MLDRMPARCRRLPPRAGCTSPTCQPRQEHRRELSTTWRLTALAPLFGGASSLGRRRRAGPACGSTEGVQAFPLPTGDLIAHEEPPVMDPTDANNVVFECGAAQHDHLEQQDERSAISPPLLPLPLSAQSEPGGEVPLLPRRDTSSPCRWGISPLPRAATTATCSGRRPSETSITPVPRHRHERDRCWRGRLRGRRLEPVQQPEDPPPRPGRLYRRRLCRPRHAEGP